MRKLREEMAMHKPRREASEESSSAGIPVLHFTDFRTAGRQVV